MFVTILLMSTLMGDAVALVPLDSPYHRVRARAGRMLRCRLTFELACRWEQQPPTYLGQEGSRRLKEALTDYFAVPYSIENAPHIDTLTNPDCTGCRCWVTQGYLVAAYDRLRDWPPEQPQPSFVGYRLGSLLMASDLRYRVPPDQLRAMLARMAEDTRKWESRQPRMADPPR